MGGEQFFLGVNCSRTRVRIGVAKRDGVLRDMADYPLAVSYTHLTLPTIVGV